MSKLTKNKKAHCPANLETRRSAAQSGAKRAKGITQERLKALAAKHKPPQRWYEENQDAP